MGIGSIDQGQNLRLIGLFGQKNNYNDDDYNGDDYNGDGFRAKFPQFSNTHNQQQSMSLTIIMKRDIFILFRFNSFSVSFVYYLLIILMRLRE